MKIKNIFPARKFLVGAKRNIRIKEVAFLKLQNNEQVVFNCFYPKKYDFVKKNWGYYATPSINSRLKNQGFKTALIQNKEKKIYLFVIDKKKISVFKKYCKQHSLKVYLWLDQIKI